MKIQIHPGHVGGAARKKDAKKLVKALQALGWPAKVITGDIEAVWDFDSYKDLNNFERHFEDVKDHLWPPYQWSQVIPCPDCGCKCGGDFEGATVLKTVIDYDPSL